MHKYIVTGGAGFIGSHLVERLLNFHEVIVIDNLSTGFESYLPKHPNLTLLKLDISNWTELSKHFAYFKGASGVFHLAACARIQPSVFAPMLTHDTNVTGTLNILEMMRMCDVRCIVYSASSSYYGKKLGVPCLESHSPDCQTPYAVSKYMGELYCDTWAQLHGLMSTRLRYFNVYGPRSPLEGQYAPVIGLFFRQAFTRKPITIVGDGEQRRDFTYVQDVVSANILAMDQMILSSSAGGSYLYNIGTGENYSMNQLAKMISDVCRERYGIEPQITHIPERIGEARYSRAVNSAARQYLRWAPLAKLDDMMPQLADYYYNLLLVK